MKELFLAILVILTLSGGWVPGQSLSNFSWGPVAANGLRLGIRGEDSSSGSGRVLVRLALRNNSNQVRQVPFWFTGGQPEVRIVAIDAAGAVFTGVNQGNTEYPPQSLTDFRTLTPGETAEIMLMPQEGLKGMQGLRGLKPGIYRLMAVFIFRPGRMLDYCRKMGLTVLGVRWFRFPELDVSSGELTLSVP